MADPVTSPHTSSLMDWLQPVTLPDDCIKVIVVRDSSAIQFSELGQKPVKVGDAIVLGANVLC